MYSLAGKPGGGIRDLSTGNHNTLQHPAGARQQFAARESGGNLRAFCLLLGMGRAEILQAKKHYIKLMEDYFFF